MERKGKHNSFVLYTDYSQHVARLSNEEAGELLKALFAFVETGELPELSGSLGMCFSFISSQIQRDKEKYMDICEKRAEAGRMGGLQKQANVANASFAKQNQANVADNDTVNESDNVNDTNKKQIYGQQVDRLYYLMNVGRARVSSKGRLRKTSGDWYIENLLKDGFSMEQILEVAEQIGSSPKADWTQLRNVMHEKKAKGGI